MTLTLRLASAALLLTTTISAHAAVIVTSTTGTLSGRDGMGIFAEPGTELNNLAYALTVSYTRELNVQQSSGPYWDWSSGGLNSTNLSSPIEITLDVGDQHFRLSSPSRNTLHDIIDGAFQGGNDLIWYRAEGWGANYSLSLGYTVASAEDWIGSNPTLEQYLARTLTAEDIGVGYIDFNTGPFVTNDPKDTDSYFITTVTSIVTGEERNEVPEPTSLALVALGAIGLSGIRRRNALR